MIERTPATMQGIAESGMQTVIDLKQRIEELEKDRERLNELLFLLQSNGVTLFDGDASLMFDIGKAELRIGSGRIQYDTAHLREALDAMEAEEG